MSFQKTALLSIAFCASPASFTPSETAGQRGASMDVSGPVAGAQPAGKSRRRLDKRKMKSALFRWHFSYREGNEAIQ